MQELARALAHLLEAERQERARAEAQEAEDQQARALAQLLRVWGAPRTNDPALGLEDDPDAPAAQLARALLRARLDPAALAAQLVPAPAPAPALRPRPPVYDDGPTGPDAEDAGDETPDLDPELLRSPPQGVVGAGEGAYIPGGGGRGAAGACFTGWRCEHLGPGSLGGNFLVLDLGCGGRDAWPASFVRMGGGETIVSGMEGGDICLQEAVGCLGGRRLPGPQAVRGSGAVQVLGPGR